MKRKNEKVKKIIMMAVLLGAQVNTVYGMDFGNFDEWRHTRSLHEQPAIVLAVAPKEQADRLMLQIKFYYEQNDDERVIDFCNEYLRLPESKRKAEHYEKIGLVYFDLTPTAFPQERDEFRLKSIECFEAYMRLEGFSERTNNYNRMGMVYTELGASIPSKQEEYCALAAKSFDKFFEKASVFPAHNYKAAAIAYYNLATHKKPLKNMIKSAEHWKNFFQFASPEMIETQDYAKAARSTFGAAGKVTNLEKEALYYAQSKDYWEEYALRNGRSSTLDNNRVRALTYYYNAIRTELESDFKKSAMYWNLFEAQEEPTDRDVANIISMNQKAASFETDPVKRSHYLQKVQDLMRRHDIHSTYQVGDIIILVYNRETVGLAAQSPMTIDIEPYVDLENHEEKEDVQVEETVPQLSKNQKKNMKKRLKAKLAKSTSVSAPSAASEEVIEDVESKDDFQDETSMNVTSSLVDTVIQEDSQDGEETATPTAPKLTKEQKKQLQLLERTAARKEQAALSGAPYETTKHTIDPLTVMQIKKAYQGNPDMERKALGVLDEILAFKKGVDQGKVLAHLAQMKKYFSVLKADDSEETIILGHNVSQFYYHGIHKSGGDASWKPGMVVRLREFANTIKQTFKAIMAS